MSLKHISTIIAFNSRIFLLYLTQYLIANAILIGEFTFAQTKEIRQQDKLEKISAAIQPILNKKFKQQTEKLKVKLELTDDQLEKVREIENRRMQDVIELMTDAVTGKKISEEVEKILTPEQYHKYLRIREEYSKKSKFSVKKTKINNPGAILFKENIQILKLFKIKIMRSS